MPKLSPIFTLFFIAACSSGTNHIGNPLLLPIQAIGNGIDNAIYQQRRGQVEVIVKSTFPTIIEEVAIGAGPTLTRAMDASGVPIEDHPARVMQLQGDIGLYRTNPEALIAALMVYGG